MNDPYNSGRVSTDLSLTELRTAGLCNNSCSPWSPTRVTSGSHDGHGQHPIKLTRALYNRVGRLIHTLFLSTFA